MLTVTSEIEFSPKTRLVESPLLRLVRGSLVSSPSTMYPLESAGSPLNSTLPYPFVPPTKSLPLPAVLMRAPEANCKGYVKSPPGLGRSSSAVASRVVDVFALLGLMIGASELTSTVWFERATLKRKLTVCLCPRPEKTLSASCGSNPCASISDCV